MLVLKQIHQASSGARIIALFGVGLIGSSIYESIIQQDKFQIFPLPFAWNNMGQLREDAGAIVNFLSELIENSAREGSDSISLAFIWSAGKAGFTAAEQCLNTELATFSIVLNLVREIMARFPAITFFFHHISSAGGLFEGQRAVDNQSCPEPKRFYGILKHKQEILLSELESRLRKAVYRPTSVYGFVNNKSRLGLIPTLIRNGIQNKVSTIYGNLSTLRDYVFTNDIAMFIAKSLFDIPALPDVSTFLLGSGKPSSIYEIRHCIENLICKKIYLEFKVTADTENTSDITVNCSAFPVGWKCTDLKTGIRIVKERIML